VKDNANVESRHFLFQTVLVQAKFAKCISGVNKTASKVFNKGGRLKNINIKYNNSSIKCVQKYTYLGVVFNASGS
jgi:hypothetical protein